METIRIGDKHYNAETLTDDSKALLSDIQKVDGELARLALQTSITNLAKGSLIDRLVEESVNLEEVQVEAAQAETTEAAPEATAAE